MTRITEDVPMNVRTKLLLAHALVGAVASLGGMDEQPRPKTAGPKKDTFTARRQAEAQKKRDRKAAKRRRENGYD